MNGVAPAGRAVRSRGDPMPARLPDDRPLVGRTVRLDRTLPDDAAGIFAALDHDEVWAAGYSGGQASRPASIAATARVIDAARSSGRAPYSVRLLRDSDLGEAGTIVGTEARGQSAAHCRPGLGDHREHHRVTPGAVAAPHVPA